MTRSPGANRVTEAPTSTTSPATSAPGANGMSGLNWYLPSMISRSGKLTPAARTRMRTPPSSSAGGSISSHTRLSGGP